MDHSSPRRRSTPARSGSNSNMLLVPASIARPSLSRSPSSRLFQDSSNKENTSTPRTSNNNNSNTPYDAFMSPLKSAMKVYPVMSPLKKRRISFASPLRQCSPNTSHRTHISEKEDENTTMTSATASVLDDLFMDDEEQDHREHDRAAGNVFSETEEQQEQVAAPEHSPTPHTATADTSQAEEQSYHIDQENVTSPASASKQTQTCMPSSPSAGDSMQCDPSTSLEVQESMHITSVEEQAIVTPPPDETSVAANIPLPPSPVKAACTPTVEAAISASPSVMASMHTNIAASIPLPASPAIFNSPAKSRASSSKKSAAVARQQAIGTPLIDRTAKAAAIPLPLSAVPLHRIGKHGPSPLKPAGKDSTDHTMEEMHFAQEDNVDSPRRQGPSVMRALPFAKSDAIPSPIKRVSHADNRVQGRQQDEHAILPFAQAENLDSPVTHTSGPSEAATLRNMPYASEDVLPSPVKQQHQERIRPCQTERTDMQIDELSKDDQSEEAVTERDVDASVQGEEEQAMQVDDAAADASRITISEAGSPLHTDAMEPELLVAEESGSDGPETCNEEATQYGEASSAEQVHLPTYGTPARFTLPPPSQATPSSSTCVSTASNQQTQAPTANSRTLARNTSASASSSTASDASLSKDATSHVPAEPQQEEEQDESMILSRVKVSAKLASMSAKSLKRKASNASIDSREERNAPEPARRITRQRSLTALQGPKDDTTEDAELAAQSNEPVTPAVAVSGKAGAITKKDEQKREIEESAGEASAKHKTTQPRTRRQSTRLASTSGLPQPSSRIARRTVTSKLPTATPSGRQTAASTQSETADQARNARDEESDDAEEHVPTVASRSTTAPARQPSDPSKEDLASPVTAPVAKRPQRSARPARNLAVDAKPLPSPRRAMSPVKRPLRAARATISASTDIKGKGKESTSARLTSEKPAGKVQLRSPGRVLLSPGKCSTNGPAHPLRSPGRAVPYQMPRSPRQNASSAFDWSSVNTQTQQGSMSGLPRTLSPERYRKTASKIFGSTTDSSVSQSSASTGPASSAASATGITAQTSPFKGLAQRLTLSGSPSLLGMSMAPELLVLAPPSPSPTKVESEVQANTAISSSRPSMLNVSTSSAPEMRRFSTPGQVASPQNLSVLQSPRRALSAQPAGAIPRDQLPSPRRVVTAISRSVSTPSGTAAGTPVRAASRVIFAPSTRPQPAAASQPVVPGKSSAGQQARPEDDIVEEAPRRSQRSARPQRSVPAIKKEPLATPMAGPSKAPAKPVVTAAQLQTLTNQNTSANRKLYNKHKVTVIHKDEDRPPSPTSKIRKTGEEEGPKFAQMDSAKQAKTARNALARATKERQESSQPVIGEKRPHFVAAGDEGIFESPVKKARREETLDDAKKATKTLKWDRELLKASQKLYTPPGNGSTAAIRPPRRAVCKNKTLELDAFGNVPECKASLSPIIPRSKVEISKIIYRDDDLDEDDD